MQYTQYRQKLNISKILIPDANPVQNINHLHNILCKCLIFCVARPGEWPAPPPAGGSGRSNQIVYP